MKSKDMMTQELQQKISAAIQNNDQDALVIALTQYALDLNDSILQDAELFKQTQDRSILASRGVRVLTAEETEYYNAVIDAMKSSNPRQAITDINKALPETVIDAVLDDVVTEFPLLAAIDFQNTAALTKIIYNKQGVQMATWGALNSAIATELEGAIAELDITHNKLTAYMVVSQDMLLEGPQWVDAYVRGILQEALGLGLTNAVVAGTGKDQPIGMMKDLEGAVTEGVYPDKVAVAVSDFGVKTYGSLLKKLAVGPTGRPRKIDQVIMVVNSEDYFGIVMPATTYLNSLGVYQANIFPFPTQVIQDVNVPSGKAIFGIGKLYKLCAGVGGNGGRLEYSDEFKFLEDMRTYKIKTYGNGQPMDNKAFLVLDISKAEEPAVTVKTKSTTA